MDINDLPFGTTDWATIEPSVHPGETGSAYWRTRQFGPIRVRTVEYTRVIWPTTGAARAISCCAWKANCTPSFLMGAASSLRRA